MRIDRISPEPSADEQRAIRAALETIEAELLSETRAAEARRTSDRMWVHASRRAAQRAGMQRGPWRMSGRLPRRSRT